MIKYIFNYLIMLLNIQEIISKNKLISYDIIKLSFRNSHYICKSSSFKNLILKLLCGSCRNYKFSISNNEINMIDGIYLDLSLIYEFTHVDGYKILAVSNGIYLSTFIASKSQNLIVGDLQNNKIYTNMDYKSLIEFFNIHKLFLINNEFY